MYVAVFALALCITCTIGLKDEALTFSPVENALPWPLPDHNDIEFPMAHGAHCVMSMAAFNSSDKSVVNTLHRDHCIKYVEVVHKFLLANKDYSIHPVVCESVQSIVDYSQLMFSFLLNEEALRGKFEEPKTFANQNAKFFYRMMANYRKLLWQGLMKQPYTEEEHAYMLKMVESDVAVRNSVMAVFCMNGANWQAVMNKLQKILVLTRADQSGY